jgi:hypothetical protein
MKKVKNLLVFLAIGMIVGVSVINVKFGAASNNKVSSSLTLKALASGEMGDGSETSQSKGKWVINTNTHVKYWKNTYTGICYDERSEKRTFECDVFVLNPVYATCGTIEYVTREEPIACSTAGL